MRCVNYSHKYTTPLHNQIERYTTCACSCIDSYANIRANIIICKCIDFVFRQ